MPISMTSVSGLLDATIVDANNEELENFFKEQITDSDLKTGAKFDRYAIRRHTAGRVVSFSLGSNPNVAPSTALTTGVFESDWIGDQGYQKASGSSQEQHENAGNFHPFEFLGYPGPSFYFDFQEDGWQNPDDFSTTLYGSGTSSWPQTNVADSRFPDEECWSRWLTIPHAAGKVYVDEPCVAMISASVKGAFNMSAMMRAGSQDSGNSLDDWNRYSGSTAGSGIFYNLHNAMMLRLGLFVDTNPVLHDDEFAQTFGQAGLTSNPNLEGTKQSWKKVSDITFKATTMGQYRVIGAVVLKGRRFYNFSLKVRPAMTFGWNNHGASSLAFDTAYWELNGVTVNPLSAPRSPCRITAGSDDRLDWFFCGGDIPATKYIETSSLHVDFYYGIDALDHDYTSSTFSTIA